ncbi:hypothetical protein HHI36_022643 [Cryptolaemus montrouzieri]|uniref:Uncharacterized protein n=1 Tax=Cryptolaemus montrouzieri TaxID=559131 RepID=A0ABD2N0J0_9CUCU
MKKKPKDSKQRTRISLDYKQLKINLKNETWECQDNFKDSEEATEIFPEARESIDRCSKTFNIPRNRRKRREWITQGLMNRINDRDAMFKSVRANPGNRELKDRYNEPKLRYYRNIIASNLSNSKEIWRIINESSGTMSNAPTEKTPKLIVHER